VKYAFVEQQRTEHGVRRLCRLLGVSSAGFYEWRSRPMSHRALVDAELKVSITAIHARSHRNYGRPRIHAELRADGITIGAKRVGRLMKSVGIAGVRAKRFRKTTDSNHAMPIACNLVARQFSVTAIGGRDRVWAGDITYIPTQEGWLYLAVVIDLASRRVIGWSMKPTMRRELVLEAQQNAIRDRRPPSGTLFHSDRGSQYACADFRELLDRHEMIASMSRRAECWDNAVVESFFGSLKAELGDPVWESRASARSAIFAYIEIWYNRQRRHSTLGYVSPEQYETQLPFAA